MGARPSTYKKGGGFLDNVDLTLVDYQFTDEFNGEPFKAGKIKGTDGKLVEKPHNLNCYITVRVDDAEENTSTTLKVGKFDDYLVSDDGHVITAADGGECNINQNSATAKFFASLVRPNNGEAGFDETLFSDDPNSIDFRPAMGHRVRTIQRPLGEEQLKSIEKLGASRLKKSKDGKEYKRTELVVDQYYGPAEVATQSKKSTAKTTKPATGKQTTRTAPAPVATPAGDSDLDTLAQLTVQDLVVEAGEAGIAKSKLSMKVLNKLMKHELREDVRKWVFSDENLKRVPGVKYDQASGLLTVAA